MDGPADDEDLPDAKGRSGLSCDFLVFEERPPGLVKSFPRGIEGLGQGRQQIRLYESANRGQLARIDFDQQYLDS